MDTFDQLNYGLQPKRAKWFRLLKTVDRDVVQAVEILLLLLLLLLLISIIIIIINNYYDYYYYLKSNNNQTWQKRSLTRKILRPLGLWDT